MPSLTVITGCMFAGKSEELLRRMHRASIAGLRTILIKPALDTRDVSHRICSRDGRCMDAIALPSAAAIPELAHDYDAVGIDEAQFFDVGIVPAVLALYGAGKRIIIAGLDADHRDQPFGQTHVLMAIPEAEVVKLRAVCMRCHGEATRTFRKSTSDAQIEIGDADKYEALCYGCYGTAVAQRTTSARTATAITQAVAA